MDIMANQMIMNSGLFIRYIVMIWPGRHPCARSHWAYRAAWSWVSAKEYVFSRDQRHNVSGYNAADCANGYQAEIRFSLTTIKGDLSHVLFLCISLAVPVHTGLLIVSFSKLHLPYDSEIFANMEFGIEVASQCGAACGDCSCCRYPYCQSILSTTWGLT